jgi:hypothetical protein
MTNEVAGFVPMYEMPRAEMKAVLSRHILDMEQRADSFPQRLLTAGGPELDFSEQSLDALFKHFSTFRVPERAWEHDAFMAELHPWWVGWYGGYVVARRIGPELCWFVHDCCAYVARCYRRISPRSNWVIQNAPRTAIEYNRITFDIHNGPYSDILWDTVMSFAVHHFPQRDPTIPDDALMPSAPREPRPLREIFRLKQSLVVLPEGHPDPSEEEETECDVLSADGRTVTVNVREDLANKRGWMNKFIRGLQALSQVESVTAQDREVVKITFQSEALALDAERYVASALAQS